MAPHLSNVERDYVFDKAREGKAIVEIHALVKGRRDRRGVQAPHLTNLRKLLMGASYRHGRVETRGRSSRLSRLQVRKLGKTWKHLISTTKNTREVLHWRLNRDGRRSVSDCIGDAIGN